MIKEKSRARWFGASDTNMILGSWESISFKRWWLEKLGLRDSSIQTKAMKTGNAFEHRILDMIPDVEMDKQILVPALHLRVNLDGNTADTIYEVKTYKSSKFKLTQAYWRQAQVEMFAYVKKLYIVAYQLNDEDYLNYFRPIDRDRMQFIPIEYDLTFINEEYLPQLRYLGKCLENGEMPKKEWRKK